MNKENCEVKFYYCSSCGNLAELIHDSGQTMVCCGKPMEKLVPGTRDGSVEKHVPVYTVKDGVVEVQVGSDRHPMTTEHHVCFILLLTEKGVYRKNLGNHDAPEACFRIDPGEEVLGVYEYCNLHGLYACFTKTSCS